MTPIELDAALAALGSHLSEAESEVRGVGVQHRDSFPVCSAGSTGARPVCSIFQGTAVRGDPPPRDVLLKTGCRCEMYLSAFWAYGLCSVESTKGCQSGVQHRCLPAASWHPSLPCLDHSESLAGGGAGEGLRYPLMQGYLAVSWHPFFASVQT